MSKLAPVAATFTPSFFCSMSVRSKYMRPLTDVAASQPGFGLAEIVAAACGRVGFQPRASVRTAQSEAAARLAAAGLGPAMVPDNIVPPGTSATVAGIDPPVTREIVAYTRAQWSPPARAFVELLKAWDWAPPPTRRR